MAKIQVKYAKFGERLGFMKKGFFDEKLSVSAQELKQIQKQNTGKSDKAMDSKLGSPEKKGLEKKMGQKF